MGKLSGKPVTPLYIYLSKSLRPVSKAYYKIGVAHCTDTVGKVNLADGMVDYMKTFCTIFF